MQLFDFHHHHLYQDNGIYNLKLFEAAPQQLFSVGIHPKDISINPKDAEIWLKEISLNPFCTAIGECGLDRLIDISEKDQNQSFEMQINWANHLKKPLIIHCVRSFSELIRFKKIAKVPMIIHGFNKKKIIADQMQDAGFYLSFGKSLLENLSLQAVFKDFPMDKLFLESDDKEFDIKKLYDLAAEIKNTNTETLIQQINNNLKAIQHDD